MINTDIHNATNKILSEIESSDLSQKVRILNYVREMLHSVSPFKSEPVDLVTWVENTDVVANDYNPNKVAPPEMQLLEVSIMNDGYTQPIVTFPDQGAGRIEVVDGFHRSRVGKESIIVRKRVNDYLPIVSIRKDKSSKAERIASTIRHNRARGKHQVSAMSEIVTELKNRNWKNARIARELGMDEDEILRLCQISGLEHLFKDDDFSNAWVAGDDNLDIYNLTDEVSQDEMDQHKIPNENDETRIYHTYDKWEHIKYDFFASKHLTMTNEQIESSYLELMSDVEEFKLVLSKVIAEWPNACEHNLTNKSLNRIAWLGQAAMAYKYKIPSIASGAWQTLSEDQQLAANRAALEVLNAWLSERDLEILSLDYALQIDRQVELY